MTPFPLTTFLIDLLANRLPPGTPTQLAAKYGIRPEHAAGMIEMRRG